MSHENIKLHFSKCSTILRKKLAGSNNKFLGTENLILYVIISSPYLFHKVFLLQDRETYEVTIFRLLVHWLPSEPWLHSASRGQSNLVQNVKKAGAASAAAICMFALQYSLLQLHLNNYANIMSNKHKLQTHWYSVHRAPPELRAMAAKQTFP